MALPKLNSNPKYEVVIPSTQQVVRFRPYLIKEEKILMIAMESGDVRQSVNAIVDTIESCIQEPIEKNKLKMFDVEYLFTQIRGKSVGEKSDLLLNCQNCEHQNEVSVSYDELKIDVDQPTKKIKITDEIAVNLSYPTYYDVMDKVNGDAISDAQALSLISACIESIQTEEEVFLASDVSSAELNEFIESLTSEQFKGIRDYVETMPRLRHTVHNKCESCGHDNEWRLEGIQDFF